MKVLVLGSTGLLGKSLIKNLTRAGFTVLGLARKNADINIDVTNKTDLISVLEKTNPDIIINAIAIVDNKLCEENPGLAYLVNTRVASILNEWTEGSSSYLIQISTDHFYSGGKNKKHTEEDKIVIVNEYARTKFLAEKLALVNANNLVIRTNIVGYRGWAQPTFLEWALGAMSNNEQINLFNDYFTSSIHSEQLAKIIIDLIKIKPNGVVNISSRDVFSKEEFIVALSEKFAMKLNNPKSIGILDSGIAKRAESLGLDVSKVEKLLGYKMPSMQEVIDDLFLEHNRKE